MKNQITRWKIICCTINIIWKIRDSYLWSWKKKTVHISDILYTYTIFLLLIANFVRAHEIGLNRIKVKYSIVGWFSYQSECFESIWLKLIELGHKTNRKARELKKMRPVGVGSARILRQFVSWRRFYRDIHYSSVAEAQRARGKRQRPNELYQACTVWSAVTRRCNLSVVAPWSSLWKLSDWNVANKTAVEKFRGHQNQ